MSRIGRFMASLILAALAIGYGTGALSDVGKADKKVVVRGNNAFALDLYATLKDLDGNLFFSPYSISTALAMTYAGTRGNTQAQMARVFHFDLDQEDLHPAFRVLINQLNAQGKRRGYQLNIANALWGQKGYRFLKEFLDLTRTNYGAVLNEVDFTSEAAREVARRRINTWVEKQTKGKIKDLIKPGILNELTRLVLTNAIYFKGDWASQFEEEQTKLSPFTVRVDKKIDVPMMCQSGDFKFMEEAGFQMLELPYVENELSMVVLLPKKMDGLAELEDSLTADNLKEWLGSLREQRVNVYLPKFKITSEFRLDKTLKSMGMTDAFSPEADFSGMTGDTDLFISAVLHKAFVDVNEEGTEAAAATGVVMEMCVSPVLFFRADHPFIFLIRDTRSGSILFLGRLMNPLE